MPTKGHRNCDSEPATKKVKIDTQLSQRCINTVRVLSADMVEKANSGHPGAPMGCAPIAHVLFGQIMKFSPANAKWFDRDRFVLSNGHACALLYSMLHLTGYDITIDDLQAFRQLGSKTPGHPENFITPGVEVSTGPLGQGISNAVGLAIAEANLAANFNKGGLNIINHFTYVLCGDGCLQEGVSSEASSLAGHLGLGKLIVCYDDNHVTIDGDTALSFTEDVGMRYNSYGWQVLVVDDANDLEALTEAIEEAKAETQRPSLIKIRTVIGCGSVKEGTGHVHGAPLGSTDLAQVKQRYGFDPTQSFIIENDVKELYASRRVIGNAAELEWSALFVKYSEKYPEDANELRRRMNGQLPVNWKEIFLATAPLYSPDDCKHIATRNRSEEILNLCAVLLPEIVGGSADLSPSNLTTLKCSGDFQKSTPAGRYIRYGVREHAMAAISNGIFAHGGFRPFNATFLNFIGYAMGAVRLSALSRFGVLYIMTHDSIGLGEDGPTHQPVEALEMLRATPNLLVIRPCDGNETVGAYLVAIERAHTPTVLSLSRHAVPTLNRTCSGSVAFGAYVLEDFHPAYIQTEGITLVIVSSGTEVTLAVSVARELSASSSVVVRVVTMPCWELFEEQTLDYQLSVFPEGVPVFSIEASGVHGWSKYAHASWGMTSFGMSAPIKDLYEHFGFTVPQLSKRAIEVVEHYKNLGLKPASLLLYPRFETRNSHSV